MSEKRNEAELDILRLLPHRFPMLMVDKVLECDSKEHIVAVKNLSHDAVYFQGHFPDDPVMPGVLQIEAMAQTGGILLNHMMGREGSIAYFTSINSARFRKILRPGDQMRIDVTILKVKLGTARVKGAVYVDDELASEAEMTFRIREG